MHTDELLNFQNELLNKLVSGGGLRELAIQIATFLKKEVLITNPSQRILASTVMNEDFSEGKLLRTSKIDSISSRATVFTGEQEIEVLAIELSNYAKKLGFLLIYEPGSDDENKIKILCQQARIACVLELLKQEELLETKRQYRDSFLFDLLYGNIEERSDIIAMGEIWGWNFKWPHVVAVFEIEGFEQYSADNQLVEMILDIAQSVLQQQDKKAILMKRNEEIVLILPLEDPCRRANKAYMNMFLKQMKAQVEGRFAERVVRVGVGRGYADPTELFRSYQEAKVALKLGYSLHEHNQTPFFIDLGVERILYNHEQKELQEFYLETLEDLERFDKSQKNDLMETLEKYVAHRCDLKKTANALFLHPNTLRYRLKKIEEILQIDMEDFNAILSLVVAFKIKYLKKL